MTTFFIKTRARDMRSADALITGSELGLFRQLLVAVAKEYGREYLSRAVSATTHRPLYFCTNPYASLTHSDGIAQQAQLTSEQRDRLQVPPARNRFTEFHRGNE